MKKIVLGYIIFFSTVCSFAQTTSDGLNSSGVTYFTLNDCFDYAFGNSFTRKNMLLNEVSKEEAYSQSKLERFPDLNISLNESWKHSRHDNSNLGGNYGISTGVTKQDNSNFGGNYGISTGVTLYQGGAISNAIEESKLSMEQTKLQTQQYENDLVIKILESFLSILGNEELLKYQKAVIIASEEQLTQGKAQFNAGTILESDYLLLEAQYATDQTNIIDTEIARENSLLSLKSLLSMEPEVDLHIVYPDTASIKQMILIPEKKSAIEQAIQTLPDLKISKYDVELANLGVKTARSSYFPTVNLNGSIGTGHNKNYQQFGTQLKDNLNEQIGLSVSIPIWDKGRTKLKTTQSKIALQQAEYNQQQTDLEIRQQVIQEYQNVVSALNKYQSNEIKQNAYSKTFDVYRAMFNVGSITAVELLQQQNNYISAMNDYIQSKYSFMLRRKILDVYMGIEVVM